MVMEGQKNTRQLLGGNGGSLQLSLESRGVRKPAEGELCWLTIKANSSHNSLQHNKGMRIAESGQKVHYGDCTPSKERKIISV